MRAARAGGLCAALAAAAILIAATPARSQSRRVEVDPQSGRIVAPSDQKSAAPSADQSTSSEGLVEEPGASPGEGVTLHLRGRFRSQVDVTRAPDGRLVEDCIPGTEPAAAP
jgi:hypothetical protein